MWLSFTGILTRNSEIELRRDFTGRQFLEMRLAVGWKACRDPELLQKAIAGSMDLSAVYEDGKIVAMDRIVGDGSFKAMLTDVIVHPDYQGHGFGRIVVEDLLNQCR